MLQAEISLIFSLMQAGKLTREAQTAPSDRAEVLKHNVFWMNKKESKCWL